MAHYYTIRPDIDANLYAVCANSTVDIPLYNSPSVAQKCGRNGKELSKSEEREKEKKFKRQLRLKIHLWDFTEHRII